MLIISATNIDDTFPLSQFSIADFSAPYILDRDSNHGGILLYIIEEIHSNLIVIENKPIESFFVELTHSGWGLKRHPSTCFFHVISTNVGINLPIFCLLVSTLFPHS